MEKKRLPSKAVLKQLEAMGHTPAPTHLSQGHANCILIDPATGTAWGAADSRKGGLALGPQSLAPQSLAPQSLAPQSRARGLR
jgi:gamma-glutamyltranspeptidase